METKFKNIEFNKYSIFGLILFSFFIFLIFSCNEKMPAPIKIKTAEVENISYYSAIAGGIFEDIDNQIIDEKGICYSTNDIPTI